MVYSNLGKIHGKATRNAVAIEYDIINDVCLLAFTFLSSISDNSLRAKRSHREIVTHAFVHLTLLTMSIKILLN